MKKKLIALLIICLGTNSFAQLYYAAIRAADSSNTYIGVTYIDALRWLEGEETPEELTVQVKN